MATSQQRFEEAQAVGPSLHVCGNAPTLSQPDMWVPNHRLTVRSAVKPTLLAARRPRNKR